MMKRDNDALKHIESLLEKLLEELVDSIKSFKESENTAICILDAGLSDEQKKFYLLK